MYSCIPAYVFIIVINFLLSAQETLSFRRFYSVLFGSVRSHSLASHINSNNNNNDNRRRGGKRREECLIYTQTIYVQYFVYMYRLLTRLHAATYSPCCTRTRNVYAVFGRCTVFRCEGRIQRARLKGNATCILC